MKAQFSRISYDETKRYTGVYQQQGRMLTDADWNELVETIKRQQQLTFSDVVGDGSPREGGILVAPTDDDPDLFHWGVVYAGGVRAEITTRILDIDLTLIDWDWGIGDLSFALPSQKERGQANSVLTLQQMYNAQKYFPNSPDWPGPARDDMPDASQWTPLAESAHGSFQNAVLEALLKDVSAATAALTAGQDGPAMAPVRYQSLERSIADLGQALQKLPTESAKPIEEARQRFATALTSLKPAIGLSPAEPNALDSLVRRFPLWVSELEEATSDLKLRTVLLDVRNAVETLGSKLGQLPEDIRLSNAQYITVRRNLDRLIGCADELKDDVTVKQLATEVSEGLSCVSAIVNQRKATVSQTSAADADPVGVMPEQLKGLSTRLQSANSLAIRKSTLALLTRTIATQREQLLNLPKDQELTDAQHAAIVARSAELESTVSALASTRLLGGAASQAQLELQQLNVAIASRASTRGGGGGSPTTTGGFTGGGSASGTSGRPPEGGSASFGIGTTIGTSGRTGQSVPAFGSDGTGTSGQDEQFVPTSGSAGTGTSGRTGQFVPTSGSEGAGTSGRTEQFVPTSGSDGTGTSGRTEQFVPTSGPDGTGTSGRPGGVVPDSGSGGTGQPGGAVPDSGGSGASPDAHEQSKQYDVYVDVWERLVIALQDPKLRDPALHGADTCVRSQSLAQLKIAVSDDARFVPPPRQGTAMLTIAKKSNITENALLRVEIHHVKWVAGHATEVTLKWSNENGAEAYPVASPGNPPSDFWDDQHVYEFFSENCELHLGAHTFSGKDNNWEPNRGKLLAGSNNKIPTPDGFTHVRRWDGYCKIIATGGHWHIEESAGLPRDLTAVQAKLSSEGTLEFEPRGAPVLMTFRLLTTSNPPKLLPGDFWLAMLRAGTDEPVRQLSTTPCGILHHYLHIARLDAEGNVLSRTSDETFRLSFPTSTVITARDIPYEPSIPGAETVGDVLDGVRGWKLVGENTGQPRPLQTDETVASKVIVTTPMEVEGVTVQGRVSSSEGFFLEDINIAVPPGAVMAFACESAPAGWLECNGNCLHKAEYAALYAAIGDSFIGHGHSINMQDDQFAIPDLRGWFVRGWDRRAQAGGRALGDRQEDALQEHIHQFDGERKETESGSATYANGDYRLTLFTEAATDHGAASDQVFGTGLLRGRESTTSTSGSHIHWYTPTGTITEPSNPSARLADETRPSNVCLMYCIKY